MGKLNPTLGHNIVRGAQSGLPLTTYRLWANIAHLPIPFLGVRKFRDITAIANAVEMKQWDIGGNFNRPICRRIVEKAGGQETSLCYQSKQVRSCLVIE